MAFDDLFGPDDFVISTDDERDVVQTENWDTGNDPDIFASGEVPDIFSTK
jgi:hypothetical protein